MLGLNLADFNGVSADEVTVAGDNNSGEVVATGGELEIARGFEFAGELDAGVDGIGADKGGVSVDQGELVGDPFVGRHRNNREVGALSGDGQGGGTAGGLTDDDVGVNMFSEASGGLGDSVIVRVVAARIGGDGGHLGVVLGVEDNFLQFLDSLKRVLAVGGFIGEHHNVGALNHGVGDIADLGAGRDWIINHGTHGLGGNDADFSVLTTEADEFALDDGDDFGANFVGHIAAGDHDGVAGLDDFFQMLVAFNGFFGLNLGDDFGLGAFLAQELAELVDVVGALDE